MSFITQGVFEIHLSVEDRLRSTSFYQRIFGFKLATHINTRDITFLWMNKPGEAMLGLWGPKCTDAPISRGIGHVAWRLPESEVVGSVKKLKDLGVQPLNFDGEPTDQAVVLAWMPAVSVYFSDPDGHSLEFISMLDSDPKADLGVLPYNDWLKKGK